MNPGFNEIFFDHLVIYSSILLENICKNERVDKF